MFTQELREAAQQIHRNARARLARLVRERDELERALTAKRAEYDQAELMYRQSSFYEPAPENNPPCPACFSVGVSSVFKAMPAGDDGRDVLRCVKCDFEVKAAE